jgi:hypothetical protein
MSIIHETITPGPRLTGTRCRCSVCGKSFNSVSVFDRHRRGNYGNQGRNRRCLSRHELLALGFTVNSAGFWIERQRFDGTNASHDRNAPAGYVAREAM